MPIYNVTIDDASPLIQYDGWWTDTSHSDSFYVDYYSQTFHPTQKTGGTAGLTFNGSAVYLFGAKRFNHDGYTVTLDGQNTTGNGYSASDLFQQMLFSQTGLSFLHEHQMSLSNTPNASINAYVDLDYVVITAGDGDASTQLQDIIWDDNMAEYSSGWDDSPNGLESNYFQQTMHRTNTSNAYAIVSFEGNAVGVYGTTSTNHGFFHVSLDDSAPIKLNGTIPDDQPAPRYQNLLYWAGGLSSGQHTVTITNIDTSGLWLDLDKFVVSRWSQENTGSSASVLASSTSDPGTTSSSGLASLSTSGAGPAASMTGLPDGSSRSSHHNATGTIIGVAVAGAVIAALIAVGLLLCRRRRRQMRVRSISTSELRRGGILGGSSIALGSIEPFTPTGWTSSSPHIRRPSDHVPLAADPRGPGSLFKGAPTSSTTTSSSSRYTPQIDLAQQATPAPASPPGQDIELVPVSLINVNPHQDFPPPNYEQAIAAGNSSRGPLLALAPPPQPHASLPPAVYPSLQLPQRKP